MVSLQHGVLGVESAEEEILAGDFGGDAEALRIEQRLGGGGLGGGGFDGAFVAAPEIGIVGEIEGAAVALGFEIDGRAGRKVAAEGVGGAAGDSGGAVEIERGKQFRLVHADEGAGGVDAGLGGGEIVVGGERAVDQAGEFAVVEKPPPVVRQAGGGGGLGFLPFRAAGGPGELEIRADHAGAQGEGGGQYQIGRCVHGHSCRSGASMKTSTCWPT